MIVRAFKHIVRSVISAISDMRQLALTIAAVLNLLLGVPESDVSGSSPNVHPLVWRWLVTFLKRRYEFELTEKYYHDVRKYAVLRGLCHKVKVHIFFYLFYYKNFILMWCALIEDNHCF